LANYTKATNLNHGDEVYYQSGEHLKDDVMIPYTVFNSENTLTTAKGEDGKLVTLPTDKLYFKQEEKKKEFEFGYIPQSDFTYLGWGEDYYNLIQEDYTKTL